MLGDTALPMRRQQVASWVFFFLSGFAFSAWAPLVPYAKERLNIEEGTLSLLLLCLGLGSIVIMPLSGLLTFHLGFRRCILLGAAITAMVLPLLASLTSILAIAPVLFLFGLGIGLLDVTINIHAVLVERAGMRTMMSGFHGLYSVGCIAGSGGMSCLLWLGLSPAMAVSVILAILAALLLSSLHNLLQGGGDGGKPKLTLPKGIVIRIGLLCLAVFLVEGSMLDWSAVYLDTECNLNTAYTGFGFAIFSVSMAMGRLRGDRLVQVFGRRNVMCWGAILAGCGLLMALFLPGTPSWILGFFLLGLGCANIVPILFTIAGQQKVMPPNQAIATVSALGYSGILMGPVLIGALAHLTHLGLALTCVATLLFIVAANAAIAERE